jgi:transposase
VVALRELGRIERTLFILSWLQSVELRRWVQVGLNKGEARNALARAAFLCRLGDGEVVDRGRFRTTPKAIEKWFTDVPPARVAMEAGTHSIWISEQLQELGHEVIVANVRELRAISHSDRKSDHVDAEKLARYARLDPEILRPIAHRTVEQQEALTLIRARNLIVRLRTAAVNGVRGLTK